YQSSSVSGQLVVCINDVPNCCADASFEIPNCSDDCNFTQVIAEAHSCDGDEFLIDVAVQVNNPGPAGYFVFVNNQIAGPFSYNEPFVTVGPFVGDGTTDYEILIIDIANPACFGSAYLEPVNCDEEACEIGSILAEASDCDEDGLFTIELNFDYNNVGDNGFTVVGNGNNYGTFSYDDLPLTFGPFEGDPEMIYEFGVFDNSNPNCGGFTEIGPIECPDPCLLSDPTVSVQCYDMEDIYELTIDFAYENTFDLFKIDGIGTFSYQELPLSLNLSYDSEQTLYIFDLDNPDCTLEITYDVPCCVLPSLNVELSECQEDGTLTAEIFVENINTQDSFYLTYGNLNGNLQTATYAYADLPVTTDAFVSNPNDQLLFQITDESFFCSAEKLLDAPYCNNEDCVEFEMINGTAFGPSNGYDSGDLISIEDEVKINYFSNEPNCTNCFTFFLNATTYPQFEYGSGKIVALSNGGMELDFSSFSETVEHLSIDFHNLGMWASLQVNADELYNFNAFSELPEEIAPGVTLEITYNNNTNSSGTLHFTGAIESVRLEGMLLLLDNACFQTSPTPDFCMDFMSMDPLNDEIILAQAGDEGIAIYEEDGVVVTAEKVEVGSAQYLEIIQLTNQELCQPAFTQANDSWLQLQGAVRLDFSSFEQKPSFLSFDYAYCEDLDSINLAINDLIRYAGIPGGIPEDLYNDFNITVSPLSNTFHEGSIRIEGNIEKLLIGGMHLRIDNICFDGIPEDEEVWPGDANSDNIAHHIDLLSLGIAYGEAGPNRLSDATAWNALEAENWDGFFEDGTNYKHADCNGDGFIDEFDRNVIDQNYGLTHGPVGGFTELPGTDIDPDIMVDFPDGSQLTTGTIFEVPVIFGTEQQPVEDVYGVAFTVYFNPDVFDPNSLVVEYPVSWFGEPGVNTMHIHKIYEEGYIEIALTRIDHNDVSGFGPIVTIRGIIDDIVGITDDVEVRVEGVLASDANEVRIPIQSINELVPLRINPFVKGNNDLEPLVFPNPTADVVTITNKADVPVQQIDVFDYSSHLVKTVHDRNEISLADLPQGVYNLKIKIEGRIYHERIVKM
ncbi:MAG: T9SS type A sorting domain-containing protein, partial [Saprospiraceae bacterium]|nr:T9SS type A sorting domain-containing protein [Saprospiraceae bacterium]